MRLPISMKKILTRTYISLYPLSAATFLFGFILDIESMMMIGGTVFLLLFTLVLIIGTVFILAPLFKK